MSTEIRKRLVVLSSYGPGNFRTVIDMCRRHSRADLKVVHLVTDRLNIPSIDLANEQNIPWSSYTFPKCEASTAQAEQLRSAVCSRMLELLVDIERHDGLDLIVSSFRRILSRDLVEYFDGRIINVHPADLSVLDLNSRKRRYVGLRGLQRSVLDGAAATRTTIHYVDAGIDTGRILCAGPWVEVSPDRPVDIEMHERRQKRLSDAPALNAALENILLGQPIPSDLATLPEA